MSTRLHKKKAPQRVDVAILTVSTTRTRLNDKSGQWIEKRMKKIGHRVVHTQIIPDDLETIRRTLLTLIQEQSPHIIILTGGTGIGPKDVTIEAVRPLFRKELTAFGTLFAQLSFEEIDSAAFLSRATAGIIDQTAVFCIPGSLKACKLACSMLILPEVGHLVKHVQDN
jgi:molybdenum cofactor biosynthesis protein B